MDQTALVGNQIDDGSKLIQKLNSEGIPVTAACWLRQWDAERWYLYIATPLVNGDAREGYRRVHRIIREMSMPFWINPFEVKLIPSGHPIATAISAAYAGRSSVLPLLIRGGSLGGESLEEAYVYPPDVTSANSSNP